jgi:hypothetical protein
MSQSCTTDALMTRHSDHPMLQAVLNKAGSTLNEQLATHVCTLRTMAHTLAIDGT